MKGIDYKKLERGRKKYSVLFFAASALFILPFIIISKSGFDRIFAGIVLSALLVLSIIYWAKGTALAAMLAAYYALYSAAVFASLMLQENVALPGFISKNIFSTLSIAVVVTLTIVIPLPRFAREYVQDKINGEETVRAKAQDLMVEAEDERHVTFETLMEYKSMDKYLSKPYSIANTSDFIRRMRIIIGYSLVALGLIGIVVFMNSEDQALSFVNSWVFWSLAASVSILISGFIIIFAGFTRSFAAMVFCWCIAIAGYYVFRIIGSSYGRSPLLFYVEAALIAASGAAAVYFMYKKIWIKSQLSFSYFQKGDEVIGVDLALRNAAPLAGYVSCFEVVVHVNEDTDLQEVDNLNEELTYFSGRRNMVFAGVALNFDANKYRLFVYTDDKRKAGKKLSRFLRKRVPYDYEISIKEDMGWETYKEYLYPDENQLIQRYNEVMIENLEAEGFDFEEEHKVIFNLLFADSGDARAFRDSALANGFEKAEYSDNTAYAEEEGLPKKYRHIASVQLTTRIGLDRMNLNCKNVMELADEYGGEFYNWVFGELLDERNVMSLKTLDNATHASSPGGLSVSEKKLKILRPDLFGLKGRIEGIADSMKNGFDKRTRIKEHMLYGDSQPAVVISRSPLIIAAYSEDIDCVVLLKFPEEYAEICNLEIKSKLISVNTYLRIEEFQKDITPGPNCHNTWTGYIPIIAEFITDDIGALEKKKQEIDNETWEYVYKLGVEYQEKKPGVFRDGRQF